MAPNNAFERNVGHRGPRLAVASASAAACLCGMTSWPAAQPVVRQHERGFDGTAREV